jgi:hypothetical protein
MGCQFAEYRAETLHVPNGSVRVLTHPTVVHGSETWIAIVRSVSLIPSAHLALFGDYGYIQLCKPGCPPSGGGGHNPDTPYIKLSHRCLANGYNRQYNITLLHEMGHIVDRQFRAVEWLQRNAREEFRFLAETGHEGATGGAGERFADCYMLYLTNVVAGHRVRHPADPAAYQGEQAQRRYRILLSTPAFASNAGEVPGSADAGAPRSGAVR